MPGGLPEILISGGAPGTTPATNSSAPSIREPDHPVTQTLHAKTRGTHSFILHRLIRLNLEFKDHPFSTVRVHAGMSRKFLILAATIVAAQVAQALILGVSPAGTLLGNLLEVSASVLAAVMCFGAARRGRGLARPFWTLVGCGMAAWGLANLGWMYYELVLHTKPAADSAVRFFFSMQGIFFAMVLFLDQDKDSSDFEPEFLLDFIQIAIVFFFCIPRALLRRFAATPAAKRLRTPALDGVW